MKLKVFQKYSKLSFKPYYNWNTFNTWGVLTAPQVTFLVLNLIITGIPSIPGVLVVGAASVAVLNLIITGIPSIHSVDELLSDAVVKRF